MKNTKKLNKGLLTAAVAGLTAVSSAASAALPTAATDALTTVQGSVTEVESAVWPVIGAVIVAGITIKLVKRFSSKI